MQILDKNWPWLALCVVLFVGVMTFMQWMLRGFGIDFGMGFAIGGIAGLFTALFAVGWRRGEMKREDRAQVLPPDH